jgi:aminoglycoside phosphotransferase (APT) family kinase protein
VTRPLAARARDLKLGHDRVRALLRLQHPDLAGLDLRPVPSAGGSALWRLGDELAVRLPRSEVAADRLCRQHRWLPALAPALPLAVPVPVQIGAPSALFPWHWTVVRWVPGEPATALPYDDKSVDMLAAFLRALHVEVHVESPPFRLAGPPPPGPPQWIHGDLGPGTVVLAGGMLSGVVGFGELCGGDPAVDLAAVARWLPDFASARLLDAYGADESMVARVDQCMALLGS